MRTLLLAGAAALAICGLAWATGYQDFNLGISAGNRDDGDTALQALTHALQAADLPQHLRAATLVARGRVYASKKQYDAAIADFTAALRVRPDYQEAYVNRAAVYAENHHFAEAIADTSSLIHANPYDLDAYVNRLILFDQVGRYDDAISDCTTILNLWPRIPVEINPSPQAPIYWLRGNFYRVTGQYDLAIADDGTAIAMNNKLAAAFADRGRAHMLKGQFGEAGADLDQALSRSAEDITSRGSLVGGVDFRVHPDPASITWNKGFAEWDMGQFDAAHQSFAQSLAASPKNSYAVLGLAISSTKASSPDNLAKNAASVDLDRWPGPIVALWLGRTSVDHVRAAAAQPGAISIGEKACQLNFYLGEWQLRHNDPVSAHKSLQAAASNCPPDVAEMEAAQVELGRALVADTNL
jgi:tetratricopeptide (TPR) repeat protein